MSSTVRRAVLALAIASAGPALAQSRPATPAPPIALPPLPEPPLPVQQAKAVGLGQCTAVLDSMSRQALTSRYDIQSGWSRTDPTHHVFQSVAALTTPGNVPPDGFAALIAAPMGAGCDGVAMQVFPLAADCQSAQKTMLKTGKLLAPMMNSRIMLDGQGHRIILLPAYKNTCIAIAVDTHFGSP